MQGKITVKPKDAYIPIQPGTNPVINLQLVVEACGITLSLRDVWG